MSRSSKQKLSTSTSADRNDYLDNQLSKINSKSIFDTVVVTDYVSNPEEYLESNVKIGKHQPGSSSKNNNLKNQFNKKTSSVSVSNKSSITYRQYLTYGPNKVIDPSLVEIMPRNSIIGINITGGKNKNNLDREEIFFPFFSHISLPIKAGEQVWIFYDNVGGRKIGYWLSRKVGSLFVDDLNYTHIDRHAIIAASLTKNINTNSNIRKDKVNTLGMTFPNPSFENAANRTLHVKEYDIVLDRSFAHDTDRREFIGEPVPRHAKKCSDLTLQGSNNTIITMTHEKAKNTGTIKMAVGRKTIPATLPNIRNDSSLEHEEVDKLALLKGDTPDLTEGSIDGNEAASLIITELDGGSIRLGNAAGSYIELKSNGDICIVPANEGVIKLGGEDANKAMVSNIGTNAAGNVIGTPFATSMGGAVGAPGFGEFASKVLVK
jgi:hypothetical protein